jgi:UDP-N-acetylmuramoylalanine--D-glutamate ligase
MTPVTTSSGRSFALFGLGGSGLATALALKAGGAEVIACDDNPDKMAEAREKGIQTGDLRELDWSRMSALVLSPGVPLTHPEPHWTVGLAKAAGVEIIGDIELFCRERAAVAPDAPFVAVTGTNGKSTTTALIAHLLRAAGRNVQMGGNIGTAILSLDPPDPARCHVVECSSFQIDLAPSLAPGIGVLLNVSPDHLDRHGTMENYAAIKERLVAQAGLAVIGIDDPLSRGIADRRAATGRPVAVVSERMPGSPSDGIFADGPKLIRVAGGLSEPIADLTGIGSLRGAHNAQNAAAAVAVARELGIADETIRSGLRSFPGLAHRMEEVGRIGRALFINDSKATNADSAEKALTSFDRIFWILGGKAKEGGIEMLRPCFGRIEKAYLIGAATDAFARTLDDGEVAYSQFPNFEVRGNRFRDLVRALPGIAFPEGV